MISFVSVLVFLLALIVVVFGFIFIYFFGIWIQAFASGAKVSLMSLVGMRLRQIQPALIVRTRIKIIKAGLRIDTDDLEAHVLAGGDIETVADALIAADKAQIGLTFQRAAAIDLAGRDVKEAVRTSVNPKVIDCPDPAKSDSGMLDAVAKDGIRLLVKARVTVRANLDKLVGGATEETIVARVGQGIVSAIGSSASYKDVLENPDFISSKVLEAGLDSHTAFEIVSIDIADISVAGVEDAANVGALLETDRAEADKKLRQAEAEGRRAMAFAAEQEMRARVQEMQARVVEAQAEVPKALAEAFRKGNLGVMDFYRMQNIMADTDMRQSISGTEQVRDKEEGK
ncbi:MAG: flotillin-like protein FloA [Lentisphaerae bacterium]|nr:flotillin-like protein FloA [Lentisphaerota bacterium]